MTQTTKGEWLDGYHQALEDAAKFIEANVQTISDPRTMMPRRGGNKYGMEYAEAIRKMASEGL